MVQAELDLGRVPSATSKEGRVGLLNGGTALAVEERACVTVQSAVGS